MEIGSFKRLGDSAFKLRAGIGTIPRINIRGHRSERIPFVIHEGKTLFGYKGKLPIREHGFVPCFIREEGRFVQKVKFGPNCPPSIPMMEIGNLINCRSSKIKERSKSCLL
jgi:hypothetical protein